MLPRTDAWLGGTKAMARAMAAQRARTYTERQVCLPVLIWAGNGGRPLRKPLGKGATSVQGAKPHGRAIHRGTPRQPSGKWTRRPFSGARAKPAPRVTATHKPTRHSAPDPAARRGSSADAADIGLVQAGQLRGGGQAATGGVMVGLPGRRLRQRDIMVCIESGRG